MYIRKSARVSCVDKALLVAGFVFALGVTLLATVGVFCMTRLYLHLPIHW
jgi:hypothetical protein